MAKPSNMLVQLEAKYKAREYTMRLFTLQYAEDAAMIAANEVFGMGEARAEKFSKAYCDAVHEMSKLIYEDGKSDKECEYARTKIDDKLREICGKNFVPWEERYSK